MTRAYRIPSRMMMAHRQARRRYPDGTLGPDYLSFEEAATLTCTPLIVVLEMAQAGMLEVIDVGGEPHVASVSVARWFDTGSLTTADFFAMRADEIGDLANLDPVGVEAGWRTELFPEGVSDEDWAATWCPFRQQPLIVHYPVVTPWEREVYRRVLKLAAVGHAPGPDGATPATAEDFDRGWAERCAELAMEAIVAGGEVTPEREADIRAMTGMECDGFVFTVEVIDAFLSRAGGAVESPADLSLEITPEAKRAHRAFLRERFVGKPNTDGRVWTAEEFDARWPPEFAVLPAVDAAVPAPVRELVMPPDPEGVTPGMMRQHRLALRAWLVGREDVNGHTVTGEEFDADFDAEWGPDD